MDKTSNDQILDLWASGRSATIVADELGISRGCVLGVVFRARKKADPRAVQRAPHWDGRVPEGMSRATCRVPRPTPTADLIRPLAAAGYTCSEIARRIGRSYRTVRAVARYHHIRLIGSYGSRGAVAVDAFISQSLPEQKGAA